MAVAKLWLKLLSALLATCLTACGADVTPGYTFTSGQSNITHSIMNTALAGNLNSTAISSKPTLSAPGSSDSLLMLSGSTLYKATLGSILLNNTNLITGQTEDTAPATNDFLLSFDTSAGGFKKVSVGTLQNYLSTNSSLTGEAKNLFVTNDGGNVITIAADEMVLKNAALLPWLVSPVALTCDLSASGANGLDTGSEASDTWYYIYVIHDGTNTAASLISTSATSPTLPTGYSYKALIGTVYNGPAGNLNKTFQVGKKHYPQQGNFANSKTNTTTATVQEFTAPELTKFRTNVSPIAVSVSGYVIRQDTGGESPGFVRLSPMATQANIAVGSFVTGCNASGASGTGQSLPYSVPLFERGSNRRFLFSCSSTTPTWDFYITGFEIP